MQAHRRHLRPGAAGGGLGIALACLATGCATRPAPAVDLIAPAASPAALAPVVPRPPVVDVGSTDLHILVAGDILPHRPMLVAVDRVRAGLEPLAPLVGTVDVAIANYETSTGGTELFAGKRSMSLAASPDWLGEVGALFHAVTVANNHACDLGRGGLAATLSAAKELGVTAIGGDEGRDPWQPRVIDEKDGRKVCAVAWTTFVNSEGKACKGSGELAIAGFDRKGRAAVESAVTRARREGCDGVVAIFHGGEEYVGPIWGVREQARIAADAGADAVVVHHPHVPSPAVVLVTRDGRKVPVFESVGNLLSNQGESYVPPAFPVSPAHTIARNAWTRLGVVADLWWSWPVGAAPHARPGFSYGYHLTWTENSHAADRDEPMPRISTRPIDPAADAALIGALSSDTRGPTRLFTDPCWLETAGARCVTRDASATASLVGM